MRRIITLAALSLSLFGGVALADNRREPAEHRVVDRDRDRDRRQPQRFERHEEARGFQWMGGEWKRQRNAWKWSPGGYVRGRR